MGRLKFRTSYGQNVLNHSREVAFLAGIMAKELGLNGHVAARAAFLHDIGKAIDRDLQGTHLELGLDFLRKHGESEPVLQAVAAHHMDIDWPSLEAMIVQAADAISAARPGARRDILESYVKRLEKLESIADSFQGVSKAFALQAGREIRIVVESDRVSDEETVWLSKDIARRIENELDTRARSKSPSSVRPAPLNTPGSASPVADARRARTHRRDPRSLSPRRRHGCTSASATMPRWRRRSAGALEVLTTDALVEGVHFDRRFSSARRHRLEGARRQPVATSRPWARTPRLALLSLALPRDLSAR